jgi:DNA polymerase III subunit epsilon
MRLNNKFWLFVIVCTAFIATIAGILAVMFWRQIDPTGHALLIRLFKEQFWYFFSTAVFLFAAFGFTLDWFFRFYIIPLNQLIEETRIMNTVNPAHRLNIDGSREVKSLAELINARGDQYLRARHLIDKTVATAKAKTEAEKNMLATIIAELSQGVLICDPEGRILLYNRQAKRLLDSAHKSASESEAVPSLHGVPHGFIGLNRSVFALIDEQLVRYALREIDEKLEKGKTSVSSHFVVVTTDHRRIGVETLPIQDEDKAFAGFVLILTDITHQLEHNGRINQQYKSMAKAMRSSVAAIRSTVDLMIQFPDMDAQDKTAFVHIIAAETESLSHLMRRDLGNMGSYATTRWPLSPILAVDFVTAIKTEAVDNAKLTIEIAECDPRCMIRIDSYAMLRAVAFLLELLETERKVKCSRIRLTAPGNLVQVDLIWNGPAVRIETLRNWQALPLDGRQSANPLTLKEILEHHHAEICPHVRGGSNASSLRLFMPIVHSEGTPEDVRSIPQVTRGRPEFFDFDLFHQPGQTPDIEKRLLGELVYTVFDTETTGLDPRGGDEIISIGAIRIVNGRLLHAETINQFVDPKRHVPTEAVKIHGIDDAMLADQPTIEKVLPFFHRFARNTVLVAHNAAFDMLMLQMKEKATGIRFINPVLDTMHLSAVIHPSHSDHTLDTIARRLGATVSRRHDAFDDAMATGEVFLKMIPLLNEKGIYTLKEALTACQRTYYARLKY